MANNRKTAAFRRRPLRMICIGTAVICMLCSSCLTAAALPPEHDYQFYEEGYSLVLDGRPQKAPIPQAYREWVNSYRDMEKWCAEEGYSSVSELSGALLLDMDEDGTEEMLLLHGLMAEPEDTSRKMGLSIFTQQEGETEALWMEYPLCAVEGDGNVELQLLQHDGNLYLGIEHRSSRDGQESGTWDVYTCSYLQMENGREAKPVLSAVYTWQGKKVAQGLYETQYDRCSAEVNGEPWRYEDFEALYAQLNPIYRHRVLPEGEQLSRKDGKSLSEAIRIKLTMGW